MQTPVKTQRERWNAQARTTESDDTHAVQVKKVKF
jgi:hypothetical protein